VEGISRSVGIAIEPFDPVTVCGLDFGMLLRIEMGRAIKRRERREAGAF
jgi:hypothetical protein